MGRSIYSSWDVVVAGKKRVFFKAGKEPCASLKMTSYFYRATLTGFGKES
jgi:hypothetical protein